MFSHAALIRDRRRRKTATIRRQDAVSFEGLCPLEPRLLMSGSPIAVDDTLTAENTGPIVIAILANDIAGEGATLNPDSITLTSGNAFGTLEIDYINGLLIYTPDAGFTGTEVFTYIMTDMDFNLSNEATVTLHVVEAQPEPEPEPAEKVDLVLVAPQSHGLSKLTLRKNGDMIEVVNDRDGSVLLSHLADDINSLSLLGADGRRASMQLTIDFAFGGSFALPAGLSITGGRGCKGDALILRGTDGADQLMVEKGALDFNGLLIDTSSIDSLSAQMGLGNDHIVIEGKTGFAAMFIHDSGGDDQYTVSLPDNRTCWGWSPRSNAMKLAMAGIFINDRAGSDSFDISTEQSQASSHHHGFMHMFRRPLWSFLSGRR